MSITPEIYRELADKLDRIIDGRNYIGNAVIEVEDDQYFYAFVISAVIYYDTHEAPNGRWSEMTEIVPVWQELHAFDGGDEVLTDWNFKELVNYLIK